MIEASRIPSSTPEVLYARHYASGACIAIGLAEGRIAYVQPAQQQDADEGESWPIAAPGLVDLQVNGYRGADFNQLPIVSGMTGDTARLLWSEGVTAFCPTVITNGSEAIREAMAAIARACREDADAARAIAGIHLEGPFISPEDGARGAHPAAEVRPPDWEAFLRWQDAAEGRIRILTMSPEWPNSTDFISRCTEAGVIVSIGHTAASSEQIADAVRAGARMSTHLGNGAHLQLPRHPNYLWEQLAQDELWSCVIADGFHLPDQVLKVVLKVKGERALLVSDAVSLSGMPPGAYETAVGGQVVLTAEGKLHLAGNDKLLAGSAQMMLRGIEGLTVRGIAKLQEAWDMGSVRPAALLGLETAAGLVAGAPADLVLFRRDASGGIVVEQTYQAGKRVYVHGA